MTFPLHAEAILFDAETTGFEEPEIIEASAVALDPTNCLAVGAQVAFLYYPSKPVEWGALATHHILPHEYSHGPSSRECRLSERVKYLVGHNIDYDWEALGQPSVKRICTLALARAVWPDLDSHTNGALYYYIRRHELEAARETLKGAHSAEADVRITHEVLRALVGRLRPRDLAHLWEMSEAARIPTKMTFGKYRGRPVAEVDNGYRTWYRKKDDTDPYLIAAFNGAKGLEVPPL